MPGHDQSNDVSTALARANREWRISPSGFENHFAPVFPTIVCCGKESWWNSSHSGVCGSSEPKSEISYEPASQGDRGEIQKRCFLLLLVVFALALHLLLTSTGYFHDRNGLTPLFCSDDPQTPFTPGKANRKQALVLFVVPITWALQETDRNGLV